MRRWHSAIPARVLPDFRMRRAEAAHRVAPDTSTGDTLASGVFPIPSPPEPPADPEVPVGSARFLGVILTSPVPPGGGLGDLNGCGIAVTIEFVERPR